MRMYPTGWSPQASPGARKHREPPAHHLRPAEPAGRSCHSISIGRRTGMRPQRARFLSLAAAASAAAVLAACSSGSSPSSNSASPSAAAKAPIVIGASVSLTGDFSADGQAFKRGYELWMTDVNRAGGLLGRQVELTFLDDKSDPTQGSTNVQQLITSDHVNLVFGPFSSLITGPTASVAARYGFAMIEGAGGARSEEHTSELQSRRDLVCRLLLEKKKNIEYNPLLFPQKKLSY